MKRLRSCSRELRRRNHIARDLTSPKYAGKIIGDKRKHVLDELTVKEIEEELRHYDED